MVWCCFNYLVYIHLSVGLMLLLLAKVQSLIRMADVVSFSYAIILDQKG